MNLYSAYDYLAFIIPGGLTVGAVYIAFWGWPQAEPGASALVILLGLAFLVGQVLASIGAWLQPVAWGHAPGSIVDPLWGVFGKGATYSEAEAEQVVRELEGHFGPGLSRNRLYQLAYTELQQSGKEGRLAVLNSQIGMCRNSVAGFLVAAVAQIVAIMAGPTLPNAGLLTAAYALGAGVFVARYKRFWGQFGDNVIRGFRVSAHAARNGQETKAVPPV
jgi:hypothetical protein